MEDQQTRSLRFPTGYSRNRVHQLAVRHAGGGFPIEPFAIAPARIEPAREQGQRFFALPQSEARRAERIVKFAQLGIERRGLSLLTSNVRCTGRLYVAFHGEPRSTAPGSVDRVTATPCRRSRSAGQLIAELEHVTHFFVALVQAGGLFELHALR